MRFIPAALALFALPLPAADISIQAINVFQAYGGGGRVGMQPSTASPLFVWDYLVGSHYEVRGCILNTSVNPPACSTAMPMELTLGHHSTLFGYSVIGSVGAPVVSPDGYTVGMSVENPSLATACADGGQATTPGQGCGNNFWTLPFSGGSSGTLGPGTNWTSSYVTNGGTGILYGLFSNASPGMIAVSVRVGPIGVVGATYSSGLTAAGVGMCELQFSGGGSGGAATAFVASPGAGPITGPVALMNFSPGYGYTSAPTTATPISGGTTTCTGTPTFSPTTVLLGAGTNSNSLPGGAGYYEILLAPYICGSVLTPVPCGVSVPIVPSASAPTLNAPNINTTCSTGAPCWWYEMSGFFGGSVNPTDYTQNSDNGVLVFMANMSNQPSWRPQGYAWNYLAGSIPNVLVPWGADSLICAWNEHFHVDNAGSSIAWVSTRGNTWSANCGPTYPSTPPLDLWSTPFWYYEDSSGYTQATTLLADTGQATRLTFFNLTAGSPASPDRNFACGLTPCGSGVFSGGSGIYGPANSYYMLSNAPTAGQSAIFDFPQVPLRTRGNGANSVTGLTTIK